MQLAVSSGSQPSQPVCCLQEHAQLAQTESQKRLRHHLFGKKKTRGCAVTYKICIIIYISVIYYYPYFLGIAQTFRLALPRH